MQIQPPSAASAAAGNISQATSRDRLSGGAADAAQLVSSLGLERVARSEAASADRDAQGGGQGLDARAEHAAEPEIKSDSQGTGNGHDSGLPVSPPEPPSQLDIVG